MTFHKDPYFWALLVAVGFHILAVVWFLRGMKFVEEQKLGVYLLLALIESRFLLVLPFVEQTRFDLGGFHWIVGGFVAGVGALFSVATFLIKPLTPPKREMELKTTGFYGIVRNPIYLGEMVAYIGWAVMWRSVIGLALAPVFWFFFLLHVLMEERELEEALGEKYLEYKKKVKGRMIPGLPI